MLWFDDETDPFHRVNKQLYLNILPTFDPTPARVIPQLAIIPRNMVWEAVGILYQIDVTKKHINLLASPQNANQWPLELKILLGFSSAVFSMYDWNRWSAFFCTLFSNTDSNVHPHKKLRRRSYSPYFARFALHEALAFEEKDINIAHLACELLLEYPLSDGVQHVILEYLANLFPVASKSKLARVWKQSFAIDQYNENSAVRDGLVMKCGTRKPWKIYWRRRIQKRNACTTILISQGLLPSDVVKFVLMAYM